MHKRILCGFKWIGFLLARWSGQKVLKYYVISIKNYILVEVVGCNLLQVACFLGESDKWRLKICLKIGYILEFVFLRNDIGMVSEWYRGFFFRKKNQRFVYKKTFLWRLVGVKFDKCAIWFCWILGVDGAWLNGLPLPNEVTHLNIHPIDNKIRYSRFAFYFEH